MNFLRFMAKKRKEKEYSLIRNSCKNFNIYQDSFFSRHFLRFNGEDDRGQCKKNLFSLKKHLNGLSSFFTLKLRRQRNFDCR